MEKYNTTSVKYKLLFYFWSLFWLKKTTQRKTIDGIKGP
jgi:hypothetical protein